MKKIIICDSSSLISLASNCMLWLLDKNADRCRFVVSGAVLNEIINYPLTTKRFKYSAVRIRNAVDRGVIEVYKWQ
ncbi:MAG: hypothetical protein V1911_03015, partial [Candidatus Micrarchaeota archaeon]